jgi:hypothetical protein
MHTGVSNYTSFVSRQKIRDGSWNGTVYTVLATINTANYVIAWKGKIRKGKGRCITTSSFFPFSTFGIAIFCV